MRRFDINTVVAKAELEQMAVDFWYEIDVNDARECRDYFTEDCIAVMGPETMNGREEIAARYARRIELGLKEFNGQPRRSNHTVVNLRINILSDGHAILEYLSINYSAVGKLPALNTTVPVTIGEVRWECRREADGNWRIFDFHGKAIMLTDDKFIRQAVGI